MNFEENLWSLPLSPGGLDMSCLGVDYKDTLEEYLKFHIVYIEDEVEKDPRVLKVQTYMGRTNPPWKSRRDNHTASFKNIGQRTDSGLSKYVWDLKGLKRGYKINWSLITKSSSYSPTLDICRSCLLLLMHLLMQKPHLGTLNVKDEFYAACRHKTPLLLSKLKWFCF